MDFELTADQQAFLQELRAYLDSLDVAELGIRTDADAMDPFGAEAVATDEATGEPKARTFIKQLGKDGWLGVGWPKEYGGGGRSHIEQWLFLEEMAHRRLPTGGLTISSIGPTIMRVGTEEQKRKYLPGMLSGEIDFAVGYSEPNAGTDLASLETRAERQGDEYIVNGQKIYTTAAHYATHIWLAVRTDETAVKHRGISVLIVPLNTPGITVRPLYTQADIRTNEVFFEDVHVPVENRVGEENMGWYIIAMALDFERIFPYSGTARDFEELIDWARQAHDDGQSLLDVEMVRDTLVPHAVDVEISRLFSLRTAWLTEEGEVPNVEASINKVWTSELRQRMTSTALSLMGAAGQQGIGSDGAPLDGLFDQTYRFFPMGKFGGGTNEIQRNIIAQRGLKLPR